MTTQDAGGGFATVIDSVKSLDARVTRLEQTPNRPNPPFEPDGEALEDFVAWLIDEYALEAELRSWQQVPPLKHELAGLCRARALDDGSGFYLVTFHDALSRFMMRIEGHRRRWEAQEETRQHTAQQAERDHG